jgi:hypothetical protein
MKKFENIEEVAQALRDGGFLDPNINDQTNEEIVDALVDLGNIDKVFVRHDGHLGLKSNLSEDFVKSPLSDIEKLKFESDIEAVLEQANRIIPLSERDLSEDDIEEIREDKISRGEDSDE